MLETSESSREPHSTFQVALKSGSRVVICKAQGIKIPQPLLSAVRKGCVYRLWQTPSHAGLFCAISLADVLISIGVND